MSLLITKLKRRMQNTLQLFYSMTINRRQTFLVTFRLKSIPTLVHRDRELLNLDGNPT